MPTFTSVRDAKEFLVGKIVEESQREDSPLSEVEEKMLYFSETGWTLPDIWEVNEAFDRDYDQAEYEQKIAKLIRSLRADARKRNTKEFAAWEEAVRILRREDHYLLVVVNIADGAIAPAWLGSRDTSLDRFLKLLVVGFGLFLVCAAILMGYMVLRR